MTFDTAPSRVWLITGCSSGFGRLLAEAVLARGERVLATARRPSTLKDLMEKYPETARALPLDVTDRHSVKNAVEQGLAVFGQLDVVVNNAGYGLSCAIEEASEQEIRDQFETNVFGVLNVIRAVLPTLRAQSSGHLVNISSLAGRLTVPTMGLYSGSKFALEGISEALAREVKDFGIRVSVIEPGGFATRFEQSSAQASQSRMPEYAFLHEEMAAFAQNYVRGHTPTGVQAILAVVDLPEPPLRQAIGPGALPRLIEKSRADIAAYLATEAIWQASAQLPVSPVVN
ncbi:MAG: SDR family NAD(P)-dependent oxidoreductase [Candidatus Sericytochromatia bacterium]